MTGKFNMSKKVSIIIPLKEINEYVREAVSYIEGLDYDKKLIEVIVLPDNEGKIYGTFSFDLKIIPTGHIYPGEKRDIGYRKSSGEIVAFIDDDVYCAREWLKKAVEIFEGSAAVAAVGGPAVTPPADKYLQQVSGIIYSSFLGGGNYSYRYMPERRREVDDYPSCNLLVRRSVLDEINGFDTEFWPGEDTVLCLKIVKDLKLKIMYDPEVLVYHHRRDFFGGHMKQVKSYATHRGYFVKRFPETSLRFSYFIPTLFTLYLAVLAAMTLIVKGGIALLAFSMPFAVYLLLLFFDGIKKIKYAPLVIPGIFLNHIFYGIYFIKGILSPKLKEEEIRK